MQTWAHVLCELHYLSQRTLWEPRKENHKEELKHYEEELNKFHEAERLGISYAEYPEYVRRQEADKEAKKKKDEQKKAKAKAKGETAAQEAKESETATATTEPAGGASGKGTMARPRPIYIQLPRSPSASRHPPRRHPHAL